MSEPAVVTLPRMRAVPGAPLPAAKPSRAIWITVLDPDPLARTAIASLMQRLPEVTVVEDAACLDAALPQANCNSILVIDAFAMTAGLQQVQALAKTLPVVVFTRAPDEAQALACYAAGASACLSKGDGLDALEAAIRTIASGWAMVNLELLKVLSGIALARNTVADRTDERAATLTSREREVLQLLAIGYSNEAIAHALHTSQGTARCHVSRIMAKLASPNRSQLVLLAATLLGSVASPVLS